MGERREVRGTNWRVRDPVKLANENGSRDLDRPLEEHSGYLQRLAELLSKPKRDDGAVP